MTASIHVLHSSPSQAPGFLRVGHTGHRKLEFLQSAGRLGFRRFVFDAAHISEQMELVKLLRGAACEVILDPNFAEMATEGRFRSANSRLPWANAERPWGPSDFGSGRNLDSAKAIAEFAVKHRVNVVLAPTHLIEAVGDPWRSIDLKMAEALRAELGRAGGTDIAIDYQILTTSSLLRDAAGRTFLTEGVAELPVENIWIRTSGFGATATGAGTKHFIEAVRHLHSIGRPLVADGAGGFAGLATTAFGAVGGLCHGVGQKESFNAADWKKPASGGGGSPSRIYVPDLDRHFKDEQLSALFEAKGGRSRFGCNDTCCCRHGVEDMIENAFAHFITQRSRQIEDLSRVPENRRAEYFLLRHLDPAVRSARIGARLKIADQAVAELIRAAKGRLVRLRDALAELHAGSDGASRSRPPKLRASSASFVVASA